MTENPIISSFLSAKIKEGYFPSAVYLIAEKGCVEFEGAVGAAVMKPKKIKAKVDTIYDLASLTKPLVTGLICAILQQRGEINLEDRVSKYIHEFQRTDKSQVRIIDLLTHTSGLAAWLPLYLLVDSPGEILRAIIAQENEALYGSKVIYSDLNFIILQCLIERVYGICLTDVFQKELALPLGLNRTFFNPPANLLEEISANEEGNFYELETCMNKGYVIDEEKRKFFRKNVIWGEVHDGNCWFMGGVSGHAGIFSTVEDSYTLAQQFLIEESILLKPEICDLFQRNFTNGLNEHRSLAFQLAGAIDSVAHQILPDFSFGHLGFTGTSLWIDPEKRRIFILYTNRTHIKKPPFPNINPIRREFLKLAVSSLGDKSVGI